MVCGPSGSGKSTLIRCVNNLEQHDEGVIEVDGIELSEDLKDIESVRMTVGMVFQRFNLFPHMTVLDNCTFGMRRVLGVSRKKADEKAMDLLERVHIANQARKFPGQLSGGQQQRVAIARALTMEPKVMLFDEPVRAGPGNDLGGSGHDEELARNSMTMICVTHEMGFGREVADRVIFMEEGGIIESSDPALFFDNPRRNAPAVSSIRSCVTKPWSRLDGLVSMRFSQLNIQNPRHGRATGLRHADKGAELLGPVLARA